MGKTTDAIVFFAMGFFVFVFFTIFNIAHAEAAWYDGILKVFLVGGNITSVIQTEYYNASYMTNTYNDTYDAGSNSTWNESHANDLYYFSTNPNGYLNYTYNATYDALVSYNTSWTEDHANGLYYFSSNPNHYLNVTVTTLPWANITNPFITFPYANITGIPSPVTTLPYGNISSIPVNWPYSNVTGVPTSIPWANISNPTVAFPYANITGLPSPVNTLPYANITGIPVNWPYSNVTGVPKSIPWANITDPTVAFPWANVTGEPAFLEAESDPLWEGNYSTISSGSNSTWNESMANKLFYRTSNPLGFYNVTNLPIVITLPMSNISGYAASMPWNNLTGTPEPGWQGNYTLFQGFNILYERAKTLTCPNGQYATTINNGTGVCAALSNINTSQLADGAGFNSLYARAAVGSCSSGFLSAISNSSVTCANTGTTMAWTNLTGTPEPGWQGNLTSFNSVVAKINGFGWGNLSAQSFPSNCAAGQYVRGFNNTTTLNCTPDLAYNASYLTNSFNASYDTVMKSTNGFGWGNLSAQSFPSNCAAGQFMVGLNNTTAVNCTTPSKTNTSYEYFWNSSVMQVWASKITPTANITMNNFNITDGYLISSTLMNTTKIATQFVCFNNDTWHGGSSESCTSNFTWNGTNTIWY